ncbi:MAG: DEAD/DEAH box helicase [Lachnospiraceae bacterium]|nr:DEAD/DEAH box helicase [Lachnospiraceae bacterium]
MGRENVLNLFDKETVKWFEDTLGEPTPVQKEAWPMIAKGKHALISAPTGTGKTLSAFLIFLDGMKRQAKEGTLPQELQLIYVSPLKSLAADIRENLRRPLEGIGADADICVGIRTGDTPQRERQQMVKKPPHILIITPESLYLMLTSKTGQTVLATAKAVIIDELHALIDTKRGAHLMLSLARLDYLCGQPLQRIGLSATIEPLETAAEYLAPEEVSIAAPDMKKRVRLEILGPYADATKGARKDPVWEELGKLVFQYCQNSRSVIAFVEGRRYAEKLSYYVNQLGGEGFARVHHGSLSKEQRAETELNLRDGKLRLLCATSSMELGIDVGEIDQVLQVGCPRTISGTMQRLGRAGHNPGRVSVMYLFPRTAAECVSCAMTASLARQGGVEHVKPPVGCLDVLAQHLVSMAAFRSYELTEVMEILPRAWSFRNVTKEDVKSVLSMLAGDYEHDRDIPVRPRILYDRIHEKVEGDGYSRMLAVSAGGTIPDKGLYSVKTQEGVTLGEVDEEFVYETQKGDRFILGSFAWRVVNISRDTVTVTQTHTEGARLPFWHGEIKGRDKRTGEAFGRMFHALQKSYEDGRLKAALGEMGLDESAVSLAAGYLERQIKASGSLPDHKTILVEHFKDTVGNSQVMVHSVFGRRINAPLSLLAAQTVRELTDTEIGSVDEEDGFLLYSYGNQSLPEGILQRIDADTCMRKLEIMMPETPVFNMAFRYNSGRALMMGVRRNGRQPLWMQRLRSAEMLEQVVREQEHPLMRETRRECIQELWDVQGVQELLHDIRSGAVTVREIYSDIPSPMSLPLQWSQEAAVMYEYAPTPRGIHGAVEEALKKEKNLVQPGDAELQEVQERGRLPQDEKQLHALLMTEGDLAAGELDIPVEWLDNLAKDGRVLYLEQGLWIAAEQEEEYTAALEEEAGWTAEQETACGRQSVTGKAAKDGMEARLHIVRRMLRYRGAADSVQTAARYGLTEQTAEEILEQLCRQGEAVEQDGRYYHAKLYSRARARTLRNRREEIQTSPSADYAALMLSGTESGAPTAECLQNTLRQYAGMTFPAVYWEKIILPKRVRNYREPMMDSFLAGGELFWHMVGKDEVCFDYQADIDWEADISRCSECGADDQTRAERQSESDCRSVREELTEKEQAIYEAIVKRGACFMQSLNGLLPGESPYDTLLSLMEKGLLYADSYLPVRQWIDREKTKKAVARQRVNMRVKALQTGRWDIVRPVRNKTIEEKLEACFDYSPILCRETVLACGFSWQEALSVLRIWEYTGQARRGYFVKDLSGAQFIRGKDYESVVRRLKEPEQKIVWINAADPAQCWGKILPHQEGRNFVCVPGTAVACAGGSPIAVMERQGKVLRILDKDLEEKRLEECLRIFIEEFKRGSIFPAIKRIVVKEYPDTAAGAFAQAGFMKEMQDYVLYR